MNLESVNDLKFIIPFKGENHRFNLKQNSKLENITLERQGGSNQENDYKYESDDHSSNACCKMDSAQPRECFTDNGFFGSKYSKGGMRKFQDPSDMYTKFPLMKSTNQRWKNMFDAVGEGGQSYSRYDQLNYNEEKFGMLVQENLLKIYCWGSIIKMNLNDQEVLLICMKLLNQRFCIIEGKVSDFGLAKLLGSGKSHITTRVMGTFGYVDHGSKLTTSAHGADQFRKADQITSRSSPHTSTQPTSASVGES
ncbi:receptor-like serine/threonine-protein kinase [Canna indica]|uniref:Receptor-like serine/threonine-protein kinase n=1 Tax=Canna indica TaxID=4628 RepID=A0AAQ3K414_9LILI|nr:receptor-like serine/threonine-protein kinase [Canna indica]